MTRLQVERHAIAAATLVSAFVGSALFILLCFYWPRAIIDWMRVIVPRSVYPTPAELALNVAVVFVVVALLLAAAILFSHWMLRRLKISYPATSLAVVLALAFTLVFTGETTWQVVHAWGNLTASDATGMLFDDGQLTLHGWDTIARRAGAASLYAGIVAATFWVVRLTQGTPIDRA